MLVESPDGWKAIRVDYPTAEDNYVSCIGVVLPGPCEFPSVIVERDKYSGRCLTKVECVAPEGWTAVDWRVPKISEYFLSDEWEVIQCTHKMGTEWPIMVPSVEVTSIAGFLPLFIRLPKEGDRVWDHHDEEITWGPLSFHELIVREEDSEPGGRKFQVPVHDVPDGYKPVAFRPPKAGELACHSNIEAEEVEPCQVQSYGLDHWLIVEKINEN